MSAQEEPTWLVLHNFIQDRRAQEVETVFDSMTPEQQLIFRQAAVAGFVNGRRFGRDEKVPPDSELVFMTLTTIAELPDIFPLGRVLHPTTSEGE